MFEHVYVIGPLRRRVSLEKSSAFEVASRLALPSGYKEFWAELGEGKFYGRVEVYRPEQVLERSQNPDWAQTFSADTLDPHQLTGVLSVAGSGDGEELVYLPNLGRYHLADRSQVNDEGCGESLLETLVHYGGFGEEPSPRPFFSTVHPMLYPKETGSRNAFSRAVEAIGVSGFRGDNAIHDSDAYFFGSDFPCHVHVCDIGGSVEVSIWGEDLESQPFYKALIARLEALGYEEF